jgi:hypothetical protein
MKQHIQRINAHGRASHKMGTGEESSGKPRQVRLSRHHRRYQHRRSPKGEPSEEIDILLRSKIYPLSSYEEAMLSRAPHLDQKSGVSTPGPVTVGTQRTLAAHSLPKSPALRASPLPPPPVAAPSPAHATSHP